MHLDVSAQSVSSVSFSHKTALARAKIGLTPVFTITISSDFVPKDAVADLLIILYDTL